MLDHVLPRAALIATIALALSGCTRTTDFIVTKHYSNVALRATQVSGTQHVDLAAEAGGAWGLRNHVKRLDLAALDATVTRVSAGGNTRVSGEVVLARAGFDPVTIGTWSEVIPAAAPHSLGATLSADGSALLLDAIHGDGKFDVRFTAASAGAITFDADATLHVAVTYTIAP